MKSVIIISITFVLLFFSISFSLVFAEEHSQVWERLADMPEARSEMESAVIDERIYVIGGLSNTNSITDSVFVFDTNDESWSIGTPMPLELHHAGVASYDDKLYVVGGYFEGWNPSDTLLIYDSITDSWSNGAKMPTPRGALTVQFVDGKLYAIGGFNEFTRAENEVYDPATDSWETKSAMPTPREHLASSVLDDQLYVIGGRAAQSNSNANEMYDYTTNTWKTLEALPTARSGLTASTLSGAIFVFGGESSLYTFEENEAYIPGEGWLTQQPMPISRHGLASFTVGENIYLIGGGVVPGFSVSAITEKYHNTIVPEFVLLVPQVFTESYPELGVKVETIAENLSIPWSIDFADDGRIFFSERTGTLQVIDKGVQKQIMNLNVGNGEGGMLGIALDPDFESNHYIYIYYTYNELFSTKNKLVRYVESNNSLSEEKILLDDIPGASYHDGGRIKFGPDGKLYITTGDAGDPNLSQRLDSVAGKILRINSDGSIPDDNPFPDSAVYSYGHRNPQGIDWDKSGVLIGTEHGPSGWRGIGHDEINLIEAGKNYGWPDVIGDETKDGLTNPVLHSGDDTWAPSGASFYYGEISQWDGLYFAASLRGQHLLAIEFDSEYNVISYEKLFLGEYGRLRDVVNGPDGLYVLTSNQDGRGTPTYNDDRILRITPLSDDPQWVENIFVWYEEEKISEQEMRNAIEWLVNQGIFNS